MSEFAICSWQRITAERSKLPIDLGEIQLAKEADKKLSRARFHFVGIGGVGMSGLAELMKNMGATVTGSDMQANALIERLREIGVVIHIGHAASHVGEVDVVVYSSAVSKQNAEVLEATRRHIPIIPRAEILAEVMRLKRGIAVGGSHGKTTTTSMLASIFIHAQQDPTIVVGGRLDLIKSTSVLGQGEWLIAEADESDGSFLKLSPEIAIITNIDNDHLDHHVSMEKLESAFLEFGRSVPFYGAAIVCGDDPRVRHTFTNFNKRIIFYGFSKENDFSLKGENSHFEIFSDGKKVGALHMPVPGKHNALNALAAIVAAVESGMKLELAISGIERYQGVDRRMQFKGSVAGIDIFDDYGHHPTEVRAVLQAMREKYPARRLIVAFQPHRYTRTELCWDDFLTAFKDADEILLWDIYGAGEKPIAGITSERLAEAMKAAHGTCHYLGDLKIQFASAKKYLRAGDVFLTLGAGDITRFGPQMIQLLGAN